MSLSMNMCFCSKNQEERGKKMEEIRVGNTAKDICGDVGEVIDIEYHEDGTIFRYVLAQYDEEDESIRTQWPAHPDYICKM